MAATSKQAYRLLTALVCEGFPFVIRQTPSVARQRGLFASKHIRRKRTLPALHPVAAWSSDASVLARADERYIKDLPGLTEAWQKHAQLVHRLQEKHQRADGGDDVQAEGLDLRFPRIAERLLVRMAKEHAAGFGNTSAVLSSLVAPRMEVVPEEWQALRSTSSKILEEVCPEGFDQVTSASNPSGSENSNDNDETGDAFRIQPQDYFGVLAALHLNVMSIGEGSSALYSPLAFANHSCEPNLLVEFHGAAAEITTAREIQAGEELFIHYAYHLDQSFDELQKHLEFNYGFSCEKGGCVCGKFSPR